MDIDSMRSIGGDAGHEEFTTFSNFPACSVVQTLEYEERCNYVSTTPECLEKRFYVNYIQLYYCGFDPRSDVVQVFGIITLISLCTIMFIILGATADKCFCPALMVISKAMGLNEQLAGVTVLAFGNGSPDLFTSLAGLNDGSRLLFNDLFGAGIYVTAFVGGMICVLNPFKVRAYSTLRDVCFFIVGVLFIDYAIASDGVVTILESALMLGIYFVYLLVITLDQWILKCYVAELEERAKGRNMKPADLELLASMRDEAGFELISRSSRVSINVELNRKVSQNVNAPANEKLFQQLFTSLNPFKREEWLESGKLMRIALIIKLPINFLLQLNIPIVDYEMDRHGWSKLLNTIQIVLLPIVVGAVLTRGEMYYGVPIAFYSMIFTLPLSVIVFCTSRTDIPPSYHLLLGFYGIFGSIFIIYSCASETVQILFVLGIVTVSSNSFLGCTLLAWGNSIGDLVANIALSNYGYQKMGYAACFGGPFFNSIMAMGCTFLYRTIISDDATTVVNKGPLGENILVFILLVLFTTLVWSILTDFSARRCIGFFNLTLYFIFFLYTLLTELEIIQSYAGEAQTGIVQ